MPLMPGDDFLYSLKIPADHHIGEEPISSLPDYFQSQLNHFKNYNYRIVPHAILQLVLMLPSWVFDFLNTMVFLIIPLCILRPFRMDAEPRSVFYLMILLFIWIFHFDLGRAYFWTSGSLNYSWMLIPQLYFTGSLYNYVNSIDYRFKLPDFISVLLISFSNEQVVLSLFGVSALIILEQFLTKRKTSNRLMFMSGILLAGGLVMLASPSLAQRLSRDGFNYDSFNDRVLEYSKRIFYYLLCYSTVLLFFLFFKKSRINFSRSRMLLILILIFSTGSMFFAPLFEPRSAVFGFMICIMLMISMTQTGVFSRIWLWVLLIASFLLGIERYPLFKDVNMRHLINKEILEANRGSRDTVFLERFCMSSKFQCLVCDDVTDDPEYMDNEPLAAYYNIHKVSLKPQYALYSKWNSFRKNSDDYLNGDNIIIHEAKKNLERDIVLEKIYFSKGEHGMDIIAALNTNEVPEDYIMILRGSGHAIYRYRILDYLPPRIRIYFLDYLEYQGRLISHDNKGYYYNHVFNHDDYAYYILSLYSMNNHSPVGNAVIFRSPFH